MRAEVGQHSQRLRHARNGDLTGRGWTPPSGHPIGCSSPVRLKVPAVLPITQRPREVVDMVGSRLLRRAVTTSVLVLVASTGAGSPAALAEATPAAASSWAASGARPFSDPLWFPLREPARVSCTYSNPGTPAYPAGCGDYHGYWAMDLLGDRGDPVHAAGAASCTSAHGTPAAGRRAARAAGPGCGSTTAAGWSPSTTTSTRSRTASPRGSSSRQRHGSGRWAARGTPRPARPTRPGRKPK